MFFDAGVKAGLPSFICDVNIRTLDDRHMSQFQLMDVSPEKNAYSAVFIFFLNTNLAATAGFNGCNSFSDVLNYSLINDGYGVNAIFKVIDFETVEFKVEMGDSDVNESLDCANSILSDFGGIRSVNGLVSTEDTYTDLLLPG